jgi:hypothetical protein
MTKDAAKIRKALIEHIRKSKGNPIWYSKLLELSGTNLILPEDIPMLTELLTEIFLFEHNAGRPLLTIIVVHKQDGDHGGRFYELASQYGYGKDLLADYEARLKQTKMVIDFWLDDLHYNLHK